MRFRFLQSLFTTAPSQAGQFDKSLILQAIERVVDGTDPDDQVLREIADTLELHESTVSRVTTQKFMLTPRGIFELKYFFGSHVATETGGSASSTAIRALIKQLVSAENTQKPLSDSQISEILGQQGIVVARRTVAKYRESMQILPVNLRKSI